MPRRMLLVSGAVRVVRMLMVTATVMMRQLLNLGLKPYSGLLGAFRSARLRRRFPQYVTRNGSGDNAGLLKGNQGGKGRVVASRL